MTKCEELGYKIGDEFIVRETKPPFNFINGEIVVLIYDDDSCCPKFKSKMNHNEEWVYLHEVERIKLEPNWSGEGLPSVEWKNGDECVFDNKTKREFDNSLLDDECTNQNAIVHHTFKNKHKFDMVLIEFEDGYCAAVMQECIRKPETPEQREERERLEAAYDLYCTGDDGVNVTPPYTFDGFKSDGVQCKFWLAIVDKTGYRKAK